MGYTINIDTSKITVIEDYKQKRGQITNEQLKERLEEFVPSKTQLLGRSDITERAKPEPCSYNNSLDEIIRLLTSIREDYGNLPVLIYNPETKCFYNCTPFDINIVPKYHLVGHNNRYQTMNIHNQNALIIKV